MKNLCAMIAFVVATLLMVVGISAAPAVVEQSQIVGGINVYVPDTSSPVKYDFRGKEYSVNAGELRAIPYGATDIRFTKGAKIITFIDAFRGLTARFDSDGIARNRNSTTANSFSDNNLVKSVYVVSSDFVLPNLQSEKVAAAPISREAYKHGITFPSELVPGKLLRSYVNPFNVLNVDITDGN